MHSTSRNFSLTVGRSWSGRYNSVGNGVCLTTCAGSWSLGSMICRPSLLQWSWQKMWHQLRPHFKDIGREKLQQLFHPHATIYHCNYFAFRVKLMQRKTASRPPHSLGRLCSPLATLPQRRSRPTSRVWPAREQLCWPPGRRNRHSLSSAWSSRCS